MGKNKTARQGLDLNRRTIAAYHEAGHVIACMGLEVPFTDVVLADGMMEVTFGDGSVQHAFGVTTVYSHREPTTEQSYAQACIGVAGCVAECILYSKQANRPSSTNLTSLVIGAVDDLVRVTALLRKAFPTPVPIDTAIQQMRTNLENEWPRVRSIAQALLERGQLSFDDVVALWNRQAPF